MNSVNLVGRWAADLELKYTPNGKAVARGRLAVNRIGQEGADFINITIWGKTAESAAEYTEKGSLVSISGRIQTGSYENKEGQTVYTFDVVAESVQFLSSKKKEEPAKKTDARNSKK